MFAALLAATLTGLASWLGALPFLFIRELPRRVYDGILGLGAGLMLSAATLGLLSEALEMTRATGSGLTLIVAGFLVGVGLAAAMDRLIPHRHASAHHQHIGHGPGHAAGGAGGQPAGRLGDQRHAVHPAAGGRNVDLRHLERDHPRVAQPRT